jgi:DNA-binding transcriptional LysR family regulator
MNLDRFNLNLFVAFEALSKADTLTQAASALYVTQPTLSVALRQLREYFDDELFVYKPKQKELTPLAQNLRPRILEILQTAKATLMLKEIPYEAAYREPQSRAPKNIKVTSDAGRLSPGF